MLREWNGGIKQSYYIQVLHGLLVTDFDFVHLTAELRFAWNDNVEIRNYEFTREEVQEDLDWLLEQEKENWEKYYIGDVEPKVEITL